MLDARDAVLERSEGTDIDWKAGKNVRLGGDEEDHARSRCRGVGCGSREIHNTITTPSTSINQSTQSIYYQPQCTNRRSPSSS